MVDGVEGNRERSRDNLVRERGLERREREEREKGEGTFRKGTIQFYNPFHPISIILFHPLLLP